MIKVFVVDDEQTERDTMCSFFAQMGTDVHEEIVVDNASCGKELFERYDGSYDLVCLDIDMPGIDGLCVARQLRALDANVMIIFVTNLAQMAIKGYEVQAFDFLVKPVNYYSFVMKMQNALQVINTRKNRNIVLTVSDGIRIIRSDELYYAEVRGHYLFYHMAGETVRQKASMKDLESKLEGLPFTRCNQCYLVNLRYVSAVNKDDIRIGDEWIRMSRPRKKAFLQSLANYIGGVNA